MSMSTSTDYSRQIALKEVGVKGQEKLRASRVLVVGCGALRMVSSNRTVSAVKNRSSACVVKFDQFNEL